jgi:hypothetical protein
MRSGAYLGHYADGPAVADPLTDPQWLFTAPTSDLAWQLGRLVTATAAAFKRLWQPGELRPLPCHVLGRFLVVGHLLLGLRTVQALSMELLARAHRMMAPFELEPRIIANKLENVGAAVHESRRNLRAVQTMLDDDCLGLPLRHTVQRCDSALDALEAAGTDLQRWLRPETNPLQLVEPNPPPEPEPSPTGSCDTGSHLDNDLAPSSPMCAP